MPPPLLPQKTSVVSELILVILLLVGCGEGGSAANNQQTSIATETSPLGQLVSLNGYMPLSPNNSWSFDISDANGNLIGSGMRSVSAVPSESPTSKVYLTEYVNGSSDTTLVIKTSDGIYSDYASDSSFPPRTAKQIGLVREYAFPAYSIGEKRIVVRQGVWGEDLDGDGKPEQFRFELTQIYRGIEPVDVSWGTTTAAHFSNEYCFTVTQSLDGSSKGFVSSEEEYLVQNIGPVKLVRSVKDVQGNALQPLQIWTIKSFSVGSTNLDTNGSLHQNVALTHNDIVYDRERNLYYASVPSWVTDHGNSIAIINPQSGAITYSSPIGLDPNKLSLSVDNKFLYAGLDGSGEIVKLSLPALSEDYRVAFGSDPFYAPLNTTAASITVSPANSDIFAVSLRNSSQAGIVLFSGQVMASKKTSWSTTTENIITFNSDGSTLYSYNKRTSEFGLRKISVAPDGLTEVAMVQTSAGYVVQNLEYGQGNLYLSSAVFSDADLAYKGQFKASSAICRLIPDSVKITCLPSYTINDQGPQLTTYDKASYSPLTTIEYSIGTGDPRNLTMGPKGQAAISYYKNVDNNPSTANNLYLLSSKSLM